jgi:DNA-binding CsgD family transcriptional regulator
MSRLSPREREVLALVSSGLTNVETGKRLGIGPHAVKFHLASIYRKLGVGNRTEAATAYVRATVGG